MHYEYSIILIIKDRFPHCLLLSYEVEAFIVDQVHLTTH